MGEKMPSKATPYILPLASILLLAVLIMSNRPQITGFFIASPQLNAEIKITANEILPEDAVMQVYLEKDNAIAKEISNSTMDEFVNSFSAQTGLKYQYGSNNEIGYEGYGFIGSQIFDIKLDTANLKGGYMLKTKISYGDRVLSETEQEVSI